VLEAAHIKPFAQEGPHSVDNGLLLRSDFHRLFDSGYVTVTPDYRIEISRRLKEEFENGRSYYPFHGMQIDHLPGSPGDRPSRELLGWHNEKVFRG
jgi:putative restriction endonuclease